MRKRATGVVLVAMAALMTAPAFAHPVCLQAYNVRNTTVVDSRTILFHMVDGTVWRNDLKNACPELRFHGFAYDLRDEEALCDNAVPIHVVMSNEICALGKFSLQTPAHS
jgi:hypothetical protein